MTKVRDAILDCLNEIEDADRLITELNRIVEKKGKEAYPIILHILTHLDIEVDEAEISWKAIIDLYQSMSKVIGHKISLRTAICEYFCSVHKSLRNPKVVEIHLFEKTLKESKYDGLTGLLNRQALDDVLNLELNRARRHKESLSLIFFDLDNFKRVNDIHGHLAGDEALKAVARTLLMEKRLEDLAGRYGGEELVLLLPETNKESARIIGERVRKKVEALTIAWNNANIRLTVSGGLSSFPEEADSVISLIQTADEAAQRAKDMGKNRLL
ncbi:GGDEF domain-containing protein [Thermodesulfobacteriota bacterium]